MSSSSNTAYIKKLVKIVYEKERQIQTMKRALKEKQDQFNAQNLQPDIHPLIKRQLEYASGQLKEVSLQMISMQEKMFELEALLEDQIKKNHRLTEKLEKIEKQAQQCQQISKKQVEELQRNQEKIVELTQQRDFYQSHEQQLTQVNKELVNTVSSFKDNEEKQKIGKIKLETDINELKVEIRRKASEVKTKDVELSYKAEEIELLQTKLVFREEEVSRLNGENQKLKENFVKLTTQYNNLKSEQQYLKNDYSIKESQYTLINETLKDYEEFAFEISQYIESAYVKHCCSGMLKSSKKLIREAQNCTTRFETAFCKMSQLQQWMDNTAEKLEKIMQEYQLPNQTLQDLSNIANSFQEKLQLCDLTERIEKQKLQMDKNQEQLLENLQKEVEKSQLKERSKLVELDEVREVLKVTKEVNRELMDEINGKQYILSQCRKVYGQVLGNKSNPEFKKLKTLLNIHS